MTSRLRDSVPSQQPPGEPVASGDQLGADHVLRDHHKRNQESEERVFQGGGGDR